MPRPKSDRSYTITSFRLSQETRDRLGAFAKEVGMSQSRVVEAAIQRFMDSPEADPANAGWYRFTELARGGRAVEIDEKSLEEWIEDLVDKYYAHLEAKKLPPSG